MKICLVIPPWNIIREGYCSKTGNVRYGYWPHLGVGYIASVLEKKGHSVEIIDSPSIDFSNKDIKDSISQLNPDLIGISSVTPSAKEAYSLINYLKKHFKNIPIIFGGVHATCFPEEIFSKSLTDIVVFGEGEETIAEVIDRIDKKMSLDGVKGVYFRNNRGRIVKNPPRNPIVNLDTIPSPAWDLYDFSRYRPLPLQYKKLPIVTMITSRGCAWRKCTYCFQAGRAAQPYRRHSPERVIKEIKELISKHGIKEIAFWDDNFLVNEKWVNKFCDLLEKEKSISPGNAMEELTQSPRKCCRGYLKLAVGMYFMV